mgnify:CR=1 FL=1|tara:strand:+ start:2345 stop:2833 length:489 start_codon:yes stop_codon:yes gene_type:complete
MEQEYNFFFLSYNKQMPKKKKILSVSSNNPPRATITEKKRGNKYRDTRNVKALRKFHKCADAPHSSGCKKSQREKEEKEGRTISKVKGKDESGKFSRVKAKYKVRGKSVGGKTLTQENVAGIREALAKDVADLRKMDIDDKKLITNFFAKKKAEIKRIMNSL